MAIALGWMQLKHQKVRLLVAVSGIAFAVILILMQLGFRTSLFESSVRFLHAFHYDLAIVSTDTLYIGRTVSFSNRRLYQAAGAPGVAAVSPVYASMAVWRNPIDHSARNVFALGVDPAKRVIDAPGIAIHLGQVRRRDTLLFDALSRPEFGPVAEEIRAGRPVTTEVNDRRIEVSGLFEVGTSFGIDGSLITSEDNFLRLFPGRARTQIDIGLVEVEPGQDVERVRSEIAAMLPADVRVLTRAQWIAREKGYWAGATPIGTVFAFGVIIGFVVGAIIVYQILFADVSDHLPEYATLKAIGYSNRFVSGIVVQQAVILAVLGFAPGALICLWLYRVVGRATRLPMEMSLELAAAVLAMTVAMCAFSGMIALRKVRSLDPADVF